MTNWPDQSNVDAFYGDPRGANGLVSPSWESANIVRIATPWKLVTSWNGQTVSKIRVHKKCAPSLSSVFNLIWNMAGQNQTKINEWGMNLYGGGFDFRLMRGANQLSMHSWGCAVDFDPDRNGYGDSTPNFANYPAVLDAFAAEGWTWGGRWSKADGMHWQAADI